MHYIANPTEIVAQINELLMSNSQQMEEIGDLSVMEEILNELGLSEKDLDGATERIAEYLVKHEDRMHRLFDKSSVMRKNEIARIYEKYRPTHRRFNSVLHE